MRRSRAARRAALRCGIVTLLLVLPGAAQMKDLPVKALFIEAAVRFITWPPVESAGGDTGRLRHAFTIGIFDNDRFAPYLTEAFSRKNPGGGVPVRYLRIDASLNIDSCDLVYIPSNRAVMLDKIITACRDKPILTVSDFPEFVSRGVILAITTENRRIKSYINETAAIEAHLGISHHLLQKSTIIAPRERRP